MNVKLMNIQTTEKVAVMLSTEKKKEMHIM